MKKWTMYVVMNMISTHHHIHTFLQNFPNLLLKVNTTYPNPPSHASQTTSTTSTSYSTTSNIPPHNTTTQTNYLIISHIIAATNSSKHNIIIKKNQSTHKHRGNANANKLAKKKSQEPKNISSTLHRIGHQHNGSVHNLKYIHTQRI